MAVWAPLLYRVYVELDQILEADRENKFFNEDYVKNLASVAFQQKKSGTKLLVANTILTGLLYLYLQDVRFPVRVFEVRVDQFPGMAEVLLLVIAFFGVGLSLSWVQAFTVERVLRRVIAHLGVPTHGRKFFLLQFEASLDVFTPDRDRPHFVGGFAEKTVLWTMWLTGFTFLLLVSFFFFAVQFVAIRHSVNQPSLPGIASYIIAWSAAALDGVSVLLFTVYMLIPFRQTARAPS
jgi:hypothetical protein